MIKTALTVVCAFVLGFSVVSAGADPVSGPQQTSGNSAAVPPVRHTPVSCVGSAALKAPAGFCAAQVSGPTTPSIAQASHDRSNAYPTVNGVRDCESHSPTFTRVSCGFDARSSTTNIALVGNSHAAQWLPALQKQADYRHWHVTTYLASACAFSNVLQTWSKPIQTACLNWVRKLAQDLAKSSFNLIVMTSKISQLAQGTTSLEQSYKPFYAGYWSVLNILHKAHKRVLVINDTPAPIRLIPQCLQSHLTNYPACNGLRSSWAPNDPEVAAARSFKDPRFLEADFTDDICQPTVCQAVVGGEIVYIDGSHLTATYDRSMASDLGVWLSHGLATP